MTKAGKVILGTMLLAGCVSYTLDSANSPRRGYVVMGTKDVHLTSISLYNDPDEDQCLERASARIHVNTPATTGYSNYKLVVGGVVYGYGTLSGDTVEWTGLRDPRTGGCAVVPKAGILNIDFKAEALPWSIIDTLGVHSAAANVSTALEVTYLEFTGKDSGKTTPARVSKTAVRGSQFELVRTTIKPSNGLSIYVPGGLSTNSTLGAWQFCANSSDYGYMTSVKAGHSYNNLSPKPGVTAVPVDMYDITTGQIVGKGLLPIGAGSSTEIVLDQGPAATGGPSGKPGISVAPGTCRTLLYRADLANSFTRTIATGEVIYANRFVDGSWSDGTREGLLFSKDLSLNLPLDFSVRF